MKCFLRIIICIWNPIFPLLGVDEAGLSIQCPRDLSRSRQLYFQSLFVSPAIRIRLGLSAERGPLEAYVSLQAIGFHRRRARRLPGFESRGPTTFRTVRFI